MPGLPIPLAVTAATFSGLTANNYPDGQLVVITDEGNQLYEARGADGARSWITYGLTTIDNISDVDTTTAAPTAGQTLTWDGTNWVPDTVSVSLNALGNQSGVVVLAPSSGTWVTMTLTGNVTLDFSGLSAGESIRLDITQDGTGSREIYFGQVVQWPGGTAYVHTGTASSRDRIEVDYDGSTYSGLIVGQDYRDVLLASALPASETESAQAVGVVFDLSISVTTASETETAATIAVA